MVSKKIGLSFYRFIAVVPSITLIFGKNGFFSIIYCGKTVRSIFMEFLGFVDHVEEDYCCADITRKTRFSQITIFLYSGR